MTQGPEQTPRWQGGGTTLLCLRDGTLGLGADVFPGVPAERVAAAHRGGVAVDVNVFLLRHADGSLDLVDTGCGALYGEAGGQLVALLAAQGVAPGDIDRVIFTHLHGDHVGGALTEAGEPAFPKAAYLAHEVDIAHWRGKDSHGGRLLAACGDRFRAVQSGEDLGHGLRTWHLPGHTPGHMGLHFAGGFALVGDLLHSLPLQLPDPSVHTKFDIDSAQASRVRAQALAWLAERGMPFSGSHITTTPASPSPILRIAREGSGYLRSPL